MIFDALGRLALGQASASTAGTSGSLTSSGSATATLLGASGASFSIAGTGTTSFKGSSGAVLSSAGDGETAWLTGALLSIAGVGTAFLVSAGGGRLRISGTATAQFAGTTAWDNMLSQAETPIAYFAEIEPWVLTDRS